MQTLVLVPLILVVLLGLLWAWWSTRGGGSPVTSVDHFHRARSAMSPDRRDDGQQAREGRPAHSGEARGD